MAEKQEKPTGTVKRRNGARVSGRGFTRTLLAGFTILSACRDGSHAGIVFTFNGGKANDGSKYRLDYADTGLTDDASVMLTQSLVGQYHLPDDTPAVFGLTYRNVMPDGKFGEAFVTNNGGQYGDRFRLPVTKLGCVPREVWQAVAQAILRDCVSPFARDNDGAI